MRSRLPSHLLSRILSWVHTRIDWIILEFTFLSLNLYAFYLFLLMLILFTTFQSHWSGTTQNINFIIAPLRMLIKRVMSPISFGRGGRDNGTPATYFNNGVRKFDRMVSLASYKGPSFSTSLTPKKDCVNMLSEAVFTWPCVHSAWSAQMPHSRPGKGPPCLRIRLCFSSI